MGTLTDFGNREHARKVLCVGSGFEAIELIKIEVNLSNYEYVEYYRTTYSTENQLHSNNHPGVYELTAFSTI